MKEKRTLEKVISSQILVAQEKMKKDNINLSYKKMPYPNTIEYHIEIVIPNNNSQENFEFLVEVNELFNTIHLYSKNIKEISDGGDILPVLFQKKNDLFNQVQFNLLEIIYKIKELTDNISLNIGKNIINKIKRNFYLCQEYDILLIKSLKYLNKVPCRHIEQINGKKNETPALCCIGEEFVCLYEFGRSCNKYLTNDEYKFTLVFFSSIKSILSFKKSLENSVVTLDWKKDQGKLFELKIASDIDSDMNNIIDILINKLKQIGFKMDIYEHKEGEIPKIDIEKIEQNISTFELKLQNEGNAIIFNKLLAFYEQAIVYYSAINDSQYVTYNTRVKELLKNEKYSQFIS